MTLPASGSISLSQVNTELDRSSAAKIRLGESAVRTLFGVASGAISISQGRGKANQFAFTISSNQTNANLATLATAAGWNGTSKVVATIGSGVYISSNSTGTPALTVSGSYPNGVSITNNGYIIGMGGAGGSGSNQCGYTQYGGSSGAVGGLALSVLSPVSITNNGTIGGGGGGGGGGQGVYVTNNVDMMWGVGAGGGGGGRSNTSANSSGGAGGPTTGCDNTYAPGNSGSSGTSSTYGTGGARKYMTYYPSRYSGAGGNGGDWGSSGSSGESYGGSGGSIIAGAGPYLGGAAGGAVSGNSNITWIATGVRLGSIT